MKRRDILTLVRNFGIMAHVDAGKTTVAEQILFNTGRIHRAGKVHEGDTTLDFDPEEAKRGITISSAATSVDWALQGQTWSLQLIDTPGHVDFTMEVERSLRVLDGAVAVFDAVAGVEPQSEAVWRQARRFAVPGIAMVNKMDRPGADLDHVMRTMRERLRCQPVALQRPVGQGPDFSGLLDLVDQRWIHWGAGQRLEGDIPQALQAEAAQARAALIEALVEHDEALASLWLEEAPISALALRQALRRATLARLVVPVLCGSALHNRGILALLDAVVHYLPSPLDVPPVQGQHPETGQALERAPDEQEPLTALAFKVVSDPYVGQVTFLRLYAGRLEAGQKVWNASRSRREGISRIFRVHASRREAVEEARAGDIVAVAGLKGTLTGDTLCSREQPMLLDSIQAPEPVIWRSIEASSRPERARLGEALRQMSLEDPSFQVKGDAETGQTLIGGMGELHLEVSAGRLARDFRVQATLGRPRVALRETITRPVEHRERFKKMTGGPGMFAEVVLRLEPGQPGSGLSFEEQVRDGAIPANFIAAVEKGIHEGATSGPLGGYPLTDLRVVLLGGLTHEVDSSELAFTLCASRALREAASQAGPGLLEPIMEVELTTPEDYLGAVIGEINARRGQVRQIQARHGEQRLEALVPLAEMFGFTGSLRSLSQGRASSSMQLSGYAAVPAGLHRQVLRQAS